MIHQPVKPVSNQCLLLFISQILAEFLLWIATAGLVVLFLFNERVRSLSLHQCTSWLEVMTSAEGNCCHLIHDLSE